MKGRTNGLLCTNKKKSWNGQKRKKWQGKTLWIGVKMAYNLQIIFVSGTYPQLELEESERRLVSVMIQVNMSEIHQETGFT